MALIYNATFDSGTRVLSLLDKAGNVISSCEVPSKELVDDITKPLTFKATQDGSTVKLSRKYGTSGAFQTSRDGGNTWTGYSINTAITLNTGDEVSFRAKADRTSYQDDQHYFYFEMTGKIEAWHNVMSLYRTSDFATYNTVLKYAFYRLFYDCTSLTKAPVLPATTLDISCYHGMFWGCTSLTKSPALPATTLEHRCYNSMFWDCTSLTEAPELPATTLVNGCYGDMFRACTSLTKSPDLSATTFDTHCYNSMFYDCSSLNEVRCKMPSSYSSSDISVYAGSWLKGVSSTGTFYTNTDADWPSGASGIPEGWRRLNIDEEPPTVDDLTKPLTFRATQDGSTVKLTRNGDVNGEFQTSRDGGNTWTDYTIGTNITINTDEEVSFRTSADRTSAQTSQNYFGFQMTGKIDAWHNVMSMLRTNDFATYESVVEYGFSRLFEGCTSLVKAPVLPATTLAPSCYRDMFNGCTSLTKAPELPATTLTSVCYSNMFYGCTSLVNAPALPATTLSFNCYDGMFNGCTSLVNAPVLPATTLVNYCYMSMFSGCTSLTKAPALPATTLTMSCYSNMFYGCTSLVNAPKLPATTLNTTCYENMFYGCTSLTKAPELPATTLNAGCYVGMFYGCTSLTKAPELPATTLSYRCYENMFDGCTSLTKAPELPATTLDENCYYGMFFVCTSLANAPALPATTLAVGCYQHMFEGCTSLTKAPALPATTLAVRCYQFMFGGCSWLNEVHCNMPSSYSSRTIEKTYAYSWLKDVSSTGTFYTNADANWPSGASGIPEGWTRSNI